MKKKSNGKQRFVLVRTYSAGVHCGILAAKTNATITLHDARRIWHWYGARTLHELSLRGCEERSRISEPVAEIELAEWIEILTPTAEARANLTRSRWGA